MFKERYRVRQLEYCNKQMFGNLIVTCPIYATHMPKKLIQPVPITVQPVITPEEVITKHLMEAERRRASLLVDQLLLDIHNSFQHSTDYNSTTSGRSSQKYSNVQSQDLYRRDLHDLSDLAVLLGGQIERVGIKLVRRLKRREALRRQQEAQCDVITCQLKKLLPNSTEEMCFTVNPHPTESGFLQWVAAMKMVAQLPGGIPPEFRRRLWLTMAEKHLTSKGVDWTRVERTCFSEWSHPDDGELGVQIVKDLHRTGCSLFCGEGGQENQALLKKVLLAYARWNKAVGYCQGFNMLAALILQVTEKSETDALKLMIYLIEGVLPDSYFADSLRGLSVDMAVFRELLRTRLPRLSKHLDHLQNIAKEGTTSYEPPLTNVFTMQWFLTLFCNCLPQPSVLRVWDLILLEGNEILLRTALAIWQSLADRIVRVRTADEFYCIMGVLTNELLENNLMDANSLIKSVVSIGPLTELKSLREHYLYNINPWGAMPSPMEFSDRQLKLYPKERLALDISALKKQYLKLRQRQRQAHIIFTAAITRQPPPRAPVAMNHLLIGKSALVPTKRLGPLKGSIPPVRIPTPSTLHWKDTSKHSPSSSSSDTELCDENDPPSEPSENSNQVSPIHELPPDSQGHLDTSADNFNLTSDVCSVPCVDYSDKSDVSDDTLAHSDYDVKQIVDIDSEDDSVDFELFLEDRVKCFEPVEPPSKEENRVSLSRRNSERALQIIQENSLILHRILQCQSRLSLSPPLTETGIDTDEDTVSKKSSESYRHAGDGMFSSSYSNSVTTHRMDCFLSENDTTNSCFKAEIVPDFSDLPLPEVPGDDHQEDGTYRSKYSEILERSRDLNAKYYSQILHSNSVTPETDNDVCGLQESKTFTNQEELIDFSSDLPLRVYMESETSEISNGKSLIISDDIPFNLKSSVIDNNLQSFLKDTESISKRSNSNENGKFSSCEPHLTDQSYEPSLDVGSNECEFHLCSIDFCQSHESGETDHVCASEIFHSQSTSRLNIPCYSKDISSPEGREVKSQNQSKSPLHHIVWSDGMQQEREFDYPLIDVSVTPSPSRLGDTSEDTCSYFSKDSGTDSTPISERDVPSAFTTSGYKSKSVGSSNNFSFENISVRVFDKKSLSATNSVEKADDYTDGKRSLSASNSIEHATPSSSRTVVEDLGEKESFIRLKKTIKSPEIPSESSVRCFFQSSSSNQVDSKSPTRYFNTKGKPDSSTGVTPKKLEEKQETLKERFSIDKFENKNHSSCITGTSNDAPDSIYEEAIGYGEITSDKYRGFLPSDISNDCQNSLNCRRIKSSAQDSSVCEDSSPTTNIKQLSPVSKEDEILTNISPLSRYFKSPMSRQPADDKISSFENSNPAEITFISSEISVRRIDDAKFEDRSIRLPSDDSFSTNKSSISCSTSPVRSPGLSRISPVRREEGNYRDFSENYRDSRSPISDSILRSLPSPERLCDSPLRSPSARENRSYEDVSPKSPSKIFNPFPVPLSTRQNKEVAVKLGLYKK